MIQQLFYKIHRTATRSLKTQNKEERYRSPLLSFLRRLEARDQSALAFLSLPVSEDGIADAGDMIASPGVIDIAN